ncbi:sensor histidine kinase [Cryptosporangium aurantiacum]|uniref:histidine kinase n=1 Tax=Cryptosporangium aurantiacum TaxID=134849 RepID=A0A1M7MMI5_9ACTN|nr:histidine kinase [Cryptosporangium aurantiacum]SHM92184.1 Signal transduction histidine kinase [Cryptosporangium aurantiacum]
MGILTAWRRYTAAHPLAVDAVLAGLLFASVAGPAVAGGNSGGLLFFAPVCAALVFRRRLPIPVLAIELCLAVIGIATGHGAAGIVGSLIAVYTVASRADRTTSITAGAVTAITLGLGTLLNTGEPLLDERNVIVVTWAGLATAAGYAVQNRRAYIAAIEERARRAEQTREEEARRRVAEERLRIARELHDVVAHSIALINVQSGVAAHLLRDQPDAAEEALRHVRAASRTVLDELGTMLGVLRQGDDVDTPVEPAPGLERLEALIETFRDAGLEVQVRVTGRPRRLAPTVDLAAYRISQESLTNAHKHGSAPRIELSVGYEPDAVRIVVRNPATPEGASVPAGTGHGLIGMRERATAVGGQVTTGLRAGTFEVEAVLPAPADG